MAGRHALDLGLGFVANFDPSRVPQTFVTVGLANRANASRLLIGSPCTITKLGIHVGVQSGNICLSIHSNSGAGRAATPGARRSTTGPIACPAPNYQEVALPGGLAVVPGDWVALAADNTTATFLGNNAQATAILAGILHFQDTAFPVPDPLVTTGYSSRAIAIVGVP